LRPVLRRVLEGRGYEVLEAVDGVDAVDRWLSQAFRVTVLLTDIVMPRRDGVELARLFREIAPSLHVLFMTAYADPEVFKDVVVDDRTALIRKPFLPSALVNSLRRLLQGRPAEAEVDS
jgi:two-component system cell cycle sensor histidine kinase/response regulator CckA